MVHSPLAARGQIGSILATGAGGAAVWLPTDITGLIFWVQAESIVGLSDNDPVSTWSDKGSGGYNATAAAALRPTYKTGILNGLPVVRFSGANQMKTANATSPAQAQPTTLFVVVKASNSNDIFDSGYTSATHLLDYTAFYARIYAGSIVSGGANNANYHIFTATFNGVNSLLKRDGIIVAGPGNVGVGALAGISLGARGDGTYKLVGDIAEVIVYNTALSQTNKVLVEQWLSSRYAIAATKQNRLVFDGDSLTSGYGLGVGEDYPAVVYATISPPVPNYNNLGVIAQTLAQMEADAAAQVDPLFTPGWDDILCVWGGTNDLGIDHVDAATCYARLVTYCTNRKATGWKIVVLTLTPRSNVSTPPDFEANRQTINANIKANYAAYADVVADVGADPNIGDYGDSDDLTYYQADKIHLNATGYIVVSGIVKTAIATL